MRRPVSAMAFGALSVCMASMALFPAAAHAATTRTATAHIASTIRPLGVVCTPPADSGNLATPDGIISAFTGCTYPDTAAGLAECDAMGEYEAQHGSLGYSCPLGNPDPGVYNLWVHTFV
jgi:hypothetical protein